jgi:enoyl-[acyl-carrier-protein] reductase (NADH)
LFDGEIPKKYTAGPSSNKGRRQNKTKESSTCTCKNGNSQKEAKQSSWPINTMQGSNHIRKQIENRGHERDSQQERGTISKFDAQKGQHWQKAKQTIHQHHENEHFFWHALQKGTLNNSKQNVCDFF